MKIEEALHLLWRLLLLLLLLLWESAILARVATLIAPSPLLFSVVVVVVVVMVVYKVDVVDGLVSNSVAIAGTAAEPFTIHPLIWQKRARANVKNERRAANF